MNNPLCKQFAHGMLAIADEQYNIQYKNNVLPLYLKFDVS